MIGDSCIIVSLDNILFGLALKQINEEVEKEKEKKKGLSFFLVFGVCHPSYILYEHLTDTRISRPSLCTTNYDNSTIFLNVA